MKYFYSLVCKTNDEKFHQLLQYLEEVKEMPFKEGYTERSIRVQAWELSDFEKRLRIHVYDGDNAQGVPGRERKVQPIHTLVR